MEKGGELVFNCQRPGGGGLGQFVPALEVALGPDVSSGRTAVPTWLSSHAHWESPRTTHLPSLGTRSTSLCLLFLLPALQSGLKPDTAQHTYLLAFPKSKAKPACSGHLTGPYDQSELIATRLVGREQLS
jgi:hypothetical protein